MNDNQEDIIQSCISNHGVDYCEVRIERSESVRIEKHSGSQDSINQLDSLGGCIRAAYKGGWGFTSFNNLSNLKQKVKEAVEQAKAAQRETTQLAQVQPHRESIPPVIVNDPNTVPIADKIDLVDRYRDIVLSQHGVDGVDIIYGNSHRNVVFANSEGSMIEQEFIHVVLRVQAIANSNGEVHQSGFSIGSLGDYGLVTNIDGMVRDTAARAAALTTAKTLKGGERTVILDPILAGVFVHEAFGHLSESDNIAENTDLQKVMYMGRKFGGKHLNFTDGGSMPGLRGSYKYDDEGTPSSLTPLVKEGVLVGRLHSRETAAIMKENPTGNARAINFNFPPIVRMTNTVIEPGEATLDDLLEGVKDGVYVRNWYGGMTQHEMFTFSSGEAYLIQNGQITDMVCPVMLTGNLFTTLENIDAVGNDQSINQGGGCGKGGQFPLPVSNGSPHIRIRKCLISGN